MSRAACVVRQSQGADDSISLELQREKVVELAQSVADEYDLLDFGVHSGFSVHMGGTGGEKIDDHPMMQSLLSDLRGGVYDYLVAWDDTRVARDQFYWEIKRAAIVGECDLKFVGDVPDESLTFRVQRAVESEVKKKEIEKAVQAVEERMERGYDHGRPPFGLTYDDDGRYLVPGDNFSDAMAVIAKREDGATYREIENDLGISKSTANRIVERAEMYRSAAESTISEETV